VVVDVGGGWWLVVGWEQVGAGVVGGGSWWRLVVVGGWWLVGSRWVRAWLVVGTTIVGDGDGDCRSLVGGGGGDKECCSQTVVCRVLACMAASALLSPSD
jgi:hypothetical protein